MDSEERKDLAFEIQQKHLNVESDQFSNTIEERYLNIEST